MATIADPALARFLWRFTHPGQDVPHEREVLLDSNGRQTPATVFAPEGWPQGRPAWILLHGITVPGRHHDSLRRMARSLAAAGHYAIAPEVASWRRLEVDPGGAAGAIATALEGMAGVVPADPAHLGIMGFSVAGRWGITAAAGFPGRLRLVASMGGYWDIERTVVAMVTGEHEWEGKAYRYRPDPYGRWIMGANLLPLLPDDRFGTGEERRAAAAGLHQLALTAGQNGAMSWQPVYDSLNASLRAGLPATARATWDLLAPPSAQATGDLAAGRELAVAMAGAAAEHFPGLSAEPPREGAAVPAVLVHGRTDRLIPFTETLRLAAHLPADTLLRTTITGLFGHTRSREARPIRSPLRFGREVLRFSETIEELLATIEA